MAPASRNPLVVTVHAVDALACFGEYKFIYAFFAHFAVETVGVIGVVASHDGLVEDRKTTDIAAI